MTAEEVADALRTGLRSVDPRLDVVVRPLADGGEGSVTTSDARAGYALRTARVRGPLGDPVNAQFAFDGTTAVVEVAEAAGLQRLPPGTFAPLRASSFGVGETIRHALDAGASRIVVAAGGSASIDGGAGLLAALGARLTLVDGAEAPPGGAALRSLDCLDLTTLDPRLHRTELVLAADVSAPLLGSHGAVAMFGPQKGTGSVEATLLEHALGRLSGAVPARRGAELATSPGAGAAGGVGFALLLLGARYRPGAEFFAELAGLGRVLPGAALAITGEGSLDEQTLTGKLPFAVAGLARRAGVPAVAVAGRCLLTGAPPVSTPCTR